MKRFSSLFIAFAHVLYVFSANVHVFSAFGQLFLVLPLD